MPPPHPLPPFFLVRSAACSRLPDKTQGEGFCFTAQTSPTLHKFTHARTHTCMQARFAVRKKLLDIENEKKKLMAFLEKKKT